MQFAVLLKFNFSCTYQIPKIAQQPKPEGRLFPSFGFWLRWRDLNHSEKR